KSTCLWQIALTAVESMNDGGPIPLFVPLAEWEDPEQSALQFLHEHFVRQHGPSNYYAQAFETHITSGAFLLLLDGLNEVPGRAARFRESVGSKAADQSEKPRQTAAKMMESFSHAASDVRE